ncbi:hypothetical protein CBR_g8949 [Chara braunii]|uniref:Peroxiredoxin n=1 Tax=Chara braunii TaxID=69332 RepID=A0A388KNB8_CHABU|nr:hypothetical protein CBR_g8949 [Chara braunii]|eukprot:GBG71531.1 hypothetical protein CBR_g8949 [Chara braunii]
MVVSLGDVIPDREVVTTHGKLKLHEYVGDGWLMLFSHPGDFTPVCTTELGKIAHMHREFEKRGVKLMGLSTDDVKQHEEWAKDVEAFGGSPVKYPIIADPDRTVGQELNMMDPDLKDDKGHPLASRALHIIGPDKRIRLSFLYPGKVGRNMDEVLRVIDALQLAENHRIATPVNWRPGDPVVISPSVSEEEAKQFPGYMVKTLPSGKMYMRMTSIS